MKILAISGSLRSASLNSALLRAMAQLAPTGISVELYAELGRLPLFNPDIETSDPPAIARLRTQILEADAVVIASPEYAHGISGAMKNALDWMVGCEAFVNKPVALLNASPRAVHALAALKEVLITMSVLFVEEASISVPVLGFHQDEAGILADSELTEALRLALRTLRAKIDEKPKTSPAI